MTTTTTVIMGAQFPPADRFRLWTKNWEFAAGADVLREGESNADHTSVTIDADSDAGRMLLDRTDRASVNVTIDGEGGRFIGTLKSWALSVPHGRHGRKELTVVALDHATMLSRYVVMPPKPAVRDPWEGQS